MTNKPHHSKKGFTLIEVLISLVLFVFISLSLMNVINQTTRSQDQVNKWIKKNRVIKNVSYMIQKDIQNVIRTRNTAHWAFDSYIGYLKENGYDNFLQTHLNAEDQTFLYSQPFPLTGLTGKAQELYLTLYKNGTDIVKTVYMVETCKNKKKPSIESQCLVRKTSSLLQNHELMDIDPESTQVQNLIENIESLHLEYFDPDSREWIDVFLPPSPPQRKIYFPIALPLAIKMKITTSSSQNSIEMNIPIYQSILSEKMQIKSQYTPPLKSPPSNRTKRPADRVKRPSKSETSS